MAPDLIVKTDDFDPVSLGFSLYSAEKKPRYVYENRGKNYLYYSKRSGEKIVALSLSKEAQKKIKDILHVKFCHIYLHDDSGSLLLVCSSKNDVLKVVSNYCNVRTIVLLPNFGKKIKDIYGDFSRIYFDIDIEKYGKNGAVLLVPNGERD